MFEDPLLIALFQDILAATREGTAPDFLPSAAELARTHKVKLEVAKKRLRRLRAEGLIVAVSYSPKRYKVDLYQLRQLGPDHPGWDLLETHLY